MTTLTPERYAQAVLAALAEGLRGRLADRDLESLGAPRDVARRMLATVPAAHPWDAQIGPFYDTADVVSLLGITKQAVSERIRRSAVSRRRSAARRSTAGQSHRGSPRRPRGWRD